MGIQVDAVRVEKSVAAIASQTALKGNRRRAVIGIGVFASARRIGDDPRRADGKEPGDDFGFKGIQRQGGQKQRIDNSEGLVPVAAVPGAAVAAGAATAPAAAAAAESPRSGGGATAARSARSSQVADSAVLADAADAAHAAGHAD